MQAGRIAITGVGVVSALGVGAGATFARLCEGESGIRSLTLFDTAGIAAHLAGEVSGIGIAPGAERADALALLAAREALAQAQLPEDLGSVALALGTTAAGMPETELELSKAAAAQDTAVWPRARRLLTHPLSYTARALEREIGAFSRTSTVCSACSSGALALIFGVDWLQRGDAEVVLAGGVDPLCRMTYAGFNALGVLDAEPCRPFDVSRRGLTLGEGAGFLVLESEAHARERGAHVLAWLSGWAVGAEAHHVTHPDETGARAAELIGEALSVAGRSATEVQYVNAHGTGTPANDAMEARAIARAFGEALTNVAVSSSKGQLGHTLGAAGAIEACICVLSLIEQRVPPTRGLEQPEAPELLHVPKTGRAFSLDAVVSNSFGFGGMDTVLLFEHALAPSRVRAERDTELVITAAATLGESSGLPHVDISSEVRDSLDPERSRRFDSSTACAARLGELLLRDAELDASNVGLVLGGAYGPVERSLKFLERIVSRGLRFAAPAEFPHLVNSASAGNVSIYLGTRGPAVSISALGSSGEAAFDAACNLVELGSCEAALASAIELADPIVAELWPREGRQRERSQGGATMLVESESAARARGRRVLCKVGERRWFHGAPSLACFDAGAAAERSVVVFALHDDGLEAAVTNSRWARAPRHFLDANGYFEALGANALARAVELIGAGARRALVLGSDAGRSFVTLLSAAEDA
jgi:3-oxoacyl-[acyl-carrier-protein] synthase II